MGVKNPVFTYGFPAGITMVPRRAIQLATEECPEEEQTAMEQLREEMVSMNVRDSMFCYSERAGMTLNVSNEEL